MIDKIREHEKACKSIREKAEVVRSNDEWRAIVEAMRRQHDQDVVTILAADSECRQALKDLAEAQRERDRAEQNAEKCRRRVNECLMDIGESQKYRLEAEAELKTVKEAFDLAAKKANEDAAAIADLEARLAVALGEQPNACGVTRKQWGDSLLRFRRLRIAYEDLVRKVKSLGEDAPDVLDVIAKEDDAC